MITSLIYNVKNYALQQAMDIGMLPVVKILVEYHIDLESKYFMQAFSDPSTPLHYAIGKAKTEIAKYLIEQGANKEALHYDKTTLHHAISKGNTELGKYLVDNDADIEALYCGRTALHHAIRQGNTELAKYLIDNNADIEILCSGRTALHYAIHKGNTALATYLIDNDADKEVVCSERTPLHHAISKGNTQLAKYLISKGAEKQGLYLGLTALHSAIFEENTELATYLIDKGANIEVFCWGQTALHLAISIGNTPVAKYLIDKGAIIDAQDKHKNTPIHLLLNPKNVIDDNERFELLEKILLGSPRFLNTGGAAISNNDGVSVMQAIDAYPGAKNVLDKTNLCKTGLVLAGIKLSALLPTELVEKILSESLPGSFPQHLRYKAKTISYLLKLAGDAQQFNEKCEYVRPQKTEASANKRCWPAMGIM